MSSYGFMAWTARIPRCVRGEIFFSSMTSFPPSSFLVFLIQFLPSPSLPSKEFSYFKYLNYTRNLGYLKKNKNESQDHLFLPSQKYHWTFWCIQPYTHTTSFVSFSIATCIDWLTFWSFGGFLYLCKVEIK